MSMSKDDLGKLTLTLQPQVYAMLVSRAQELGMSVEEYLDELLRKPLPSESRIKAGFAWLRSLEAENKASASKQKSES
jgi:hypothetical protein